MLTQPQLQDFRLKLLTRMLELAEEITKKESLGQCVDGLICKYQYLSLMKDAIFMEDSDLTRDEIETMVYRAISRGRLNEVVPSSINIVSEILFGDGNGDGDHTFILSEINLLKQEIILINERLDNLPDDKHSLEVVVNLANGSLGKYTNGQTISYMEKTIEEILTDLAQEVIVPAVSISSNTTQLEFNTVGIEPVLTLGYLARTVGATLTNLKLEKSRDGVTWETLYNDIAAITEYTDTNANPTIDNRAITYKLTATDSAGNTNFATTAINFYYRFFWGAGNPADPRTLASNQLSNAGNSLTLNTGSTEIYFSIYIKGKSIADIFDLDASNASVKSDYILIDSNAVVNSEAGVAISGYNRYLKTNGVHYTSNHRHNIILQ